MTTALTLKPVAVPVAEEPPDLDEALNKLDLALGTLDDLMTRAQTLPSEIATIESRHEALTNQELDSIEAIQSRSAEMSKISAMRELAKMRQQKLRTAIAAQKENVIKVGLRVERLLDAQWYANYTRVAEQAKIEFTRLFHKSWGLDGLLVAYRPIVLLESLKFASTTTFNEALKLVKYRILRSAVDKLRAFEQMSFEDISARLDEMDAASREQLRINQGTQPSWHKKSEPVTAADKPGMSSYERKYGWPEPKSVQTSSAQR